MKTFGILNTFFLFLKKNNLSYLSFSQIRGDETAVVAFITVKYRDFLAEYPSLLLVYNSYNGIFPSRIVVCLSERIFYLK